MKKLGTVMGMVALGAVFVAGQASTRLFAAAPAMSPGARADAALEISNLMGRYGQYASRGRLAEMEKLFAMKTEGVSYRVPAGPVGIAEMTAYFARQREAGRGEQANPGAMNLHAVQTPIIEIAADGATAKGMWDSLGPNVSATTVGNWTWVRYGVDFIKEGGQWKIWHLQNYPVFDTPYDKSWTVSARERRDAASAGKAAPPGSPPALPGMLSVYDGVNAAPRDPAVIPEPYRTFDPAAAYVVR